MQCNTFCNTFLQKNDISLLRAPFEGNVQSGLKNSVCYMEASAKKCPLQRSSLKAEFNRNQPVLEKNVRYGEAHIMSATVRLHCILN